MGHEGGSDGDVEVKPETGRGANAPDVGGHVVSRNGSRGSAGIADVGRGCSVLAGADEGCDTGDDVGGAERWSANAQEATSERCEVGMGGVEGGVTEGGFAKSHEADEARSSSLFQTPWRTLLGEGVALSDEDLPLRWR